MQSVSRSYRGCNSFCGLVHPADAQECFSRVAMANSYCPAGIHRAGQLDRAEIDAAGNLGRPVPDFRSLAPIEASIGTDSAQEVWFPVRGAILARNAQAGMVAAGYLRRDDILDFSAHFKMFPMGGCGHIPTGGNARHVGPAPHAFGFADSRAGKV